MRIQRIYVNPKLARIMKIKSAEKNMSIIKFSEELADILESDRNEQNEKRKKFFRL